AITQLRAARTGPVCDASWPKGWSPERRLAVERSLRTAGLDPARALASLDRRVARTLELRERGCVESARGASERAEWTRRLVCVDETWAKTGRSVAALVRPDPAQVREAADELAEVPPVERCERGSLSAVPEALAPAQQARYEALAETIQRLETDSSVKPPERLAKLRAMQPDIDALHYAPLDARWRWGLGHALSDAHDLAAAAKEFAVSAETGLAAGDDNLYVRALIAQLHQTRAGSADQIALLESQAEAGARRLANPQVDAQLLIARANVYMERGDNAKARTLFERADAVYQQIALAPMAMHVMVLQNLGAICLETGDMAAGDRYLDRAVELARLRYTDAGAPYWEARGARATSYLFRKDLAKAEPELRAAADGIERTSPTSGQAGMLRAYLCILLLGKNQVADARAQCAASVQAMQALGADTPAQVWPLTLSGQVELRDDHVDLALAFLERAVRLAEQNHVRPIELTVAQAYYAIALRAGKRTADANALARIVAPKLRDPAVAESRGDFVRYFPELRAQASP
ncbi:MAG TPA: tetratricopeptide repeat protein, partial [Kofleriaceae bacterium]|nr:tetratricopeptide repeat protein [Kofleriaceae bacterium]